MRLCGFRVWWLLCGCSCQQSQIQSSAKKVGGTETVIRGEEGEGEEEERAM